MAPKELMVNLDNKYEKVHDGWYSVPDDHYFCRVFQEIQAQEDLRE